MLERGAAEPGGEEGVVYVSDESTPWTVRVTDANGDALRGRQVSIRLLDQHGTSDCAFPKFVDGNTTDQDGKVSFTVQGGAEYPIVNVVVRDVASKVEAKSTVEVRAYKLEAGVNSLVLGRSDAEFVHLKIIGPLARRRRVYAHLSNDNIWLLNSWQQNWNGDTVSFQVNSRTRVGTTRIRWSLEGGGEATTIVDVK
ncbi:MAG TPA: hypothetical protein VER17_05275 [Tepidisphaeraceae bacterium]|nr:hypothetical protein [Tepidisphaeraceae bacterium]